MPSLDLDFLKEQYRLEVERQDRVMNTLNLTVGVMALVVGLVGATTRDFSWSLPWLNLPYGLLLGVAGLASVGALCFLFRAVFGYSYQMIPSAATLLQYRADLKSYIAQTSATPEPAELDREVETKFEEYLTLRIVEAIDHNAKTNDARGVRLYWVNAFLVLALAAALVSGTLFLIDVHFA